MKAILEFNLPEDNEEHYSAINGVKYRCVINNFDNWLRSKLKYEELTEIEYSIYEKVREELRNNMEGLEY